MLISPIENFIFFSTILAFVCFAICLVAKLMAEQRLWNLAPQTLIRLYTRALVIPPILSAWIVTAAFLPEWWLPDAFNAAHSTPHDLHLLADLTAKLEPKLAYMMLLFAVGATLFSAWSGLQNYLRVSQLVSRLEISAEPAAPHQLALVEEVARRYGLKVGLVMSYYSFSFVWGFRKSKLILSTGLLHTLTGEELRGLLEHEAAHHERRDNLIKLALSFCTYASLAIPFSRQLQRWRSLEVERFCDEIAASRTNAPLDIASALVKLRRQPSPTPLAASGFVADSSSSFHLRVCRLIESVNESSFAYSQGVVRRRQIWSGVTYASIFIASLLLSIYFSPFAFHQAAESLIQLFK